MPLTINPAMKNRAQKVLKQMQADGRISTNNAARLAADETFMSSGGDYFTAGITDPPPPELPTVDWDAEFTNPGYEMPIVNEPLVLNADGVPHLISPTINWEGLYNARQGFAAGWETNDITADESMTLNTDGVPPLVSPTFDWEADYERRRGGRSRK